MLPEAKNAMNEHSRSCFSLHPVCRMQLGSASRHRLAFEVAVQDALERNKAISEFADGCSKIVESLEDIQMWADEASSSKSSLLITAIENLEFLVTLVESRWIIN